jgi:hypothetical protein
MFKSNPLAEKASAILFQNTERNSSWKPSWPKTEPEI